MTTAIALVLVACLADAPCEEFRILAPNPITCMVFGEVLVVQWKEMNPDYEVMRWKCEDNKT